MTNRLEATDVAVDWNAFVQADIRSTIDDGESPAIYRNEAAAGVALKAQLIPWKLRFIADLTFVWSGFTKDTEFEGLTTRKGVSPYYLESDSAYIEILQIIPWLDMRIGRQIVQWGAADQFNPTNNINAMDLEDPLAFGKTIGNQMIRLDFNPADSDFVLTAVWVPVFQPAQLPASALLQVGDASAELPFISPTTRLNAERLRNIYLTNPDSYDVASPNVTAKMPDFALRNSQVGVRAQWLIGRVDTSISWYLGRDSVPVSGRSYSTRESSERITASGISAIRVETDVSLYYPRKQVLGFDIAGELPFLDNAGIWFEGAVTFPQKKMMTFDITNIVSSARVLKDEVVSKTPFFKCTAGMDYSFNKNIYVLGQYIHGFPDEFGKEALRDYWMVMMDIKLMQERLTLRNVLLGEIPHQDDDLNLDDDNDGRVESLARGATADGKIGSIVYFPEIIAKPLDGLELILGAYLRFGHKESKFAMDAAGPSQVVLSARAAF
ncbi:MAG: hypothetical protein JXR76_28525 [Deltaproteobacteria bacterium]|nr:hypothetical protein [Deltaproteobacteria bacterium]